MPSNGEDTFPRLADEPIIDADLRSCLLEDIQHDRYAATTCLHCCTEIKIQNFTELYPGAHICMAGESLKFNFCKRQYSGYKHHALVTSVEPINNGLSAVLSMIHFIWTPMGKAIKIRKTKEIRHLYNDEIILVKYRTITNTQDEIVRRAHELLQNSEDHTYSIIEYNCEHLVRWCVNGTSTSLQVENVFKQVTQWGCEIGGTIGKIVRWVADIRDINFIREMTNAAGLSAEEIISMGKSKTFILGSKLILGAIVAFYLVVCVYKTYKTYKKYKSKEICGCCRYRQMAEIWIQFLTYLVTNVGGYFFYLLASNSYIKALVFVGCLILSLVLMYILPQAWNKFKGPFHGENSSVSDLTDIKKGDIVTFHYFGLRHDAVVSMVQIDETSENRKGKISVIHYAWPSIFFRRTVKEETLTFDLKKEKLWINQYNGYDTYPPDEVVKRARLRRGETKFAMFSNRSPHFCFWAKVRSSKQNAEQKEIFSSQLVYERPFNEETDGVLPLVFVDNRMGKLYSSHLIGKQEIRTREEIKKGDLIEFAYGLSPFHTAVCTGISDCPSDDADDNCIIVYIMAKSTLWLKKISHLT